MVGQQTLNLFIGVRIPVLELNKITTLWGGNFIIF